MTRFAKTDRKRVVIEIGRLWGGNCFSTRENKNDSPKK